MDNKGFTLIEVLAVVVILSLLVLLVGRGVSGAIEASRLRSEDVFVDKIASLIDDYLDYVTLNSGSFIEDDSSDVIVFDKCYDYNGLGECRSDSSVSVKANLMKKDDGSSITLRDLVDTGLISEDDLVNPRVNERCSNLDNTEIYLFKDSDYVYYYFVDLSDSCKVREEVRDNGEYVNIINTLPDNFCSESTGSLDDGEVFSRSNSEILVSILGMDNALKICEGVS